jgi:riboflavin kinase/FMN adenylyltransferase
MRVITSIAEAQPAIPSVVSIGNFDGVHLGHRAILESVVRRAKELGCRSAAITFSPHPIRFLAPYKAPKLISTIDQKIRLIGSTGIDLLLILNFDENISRLSPQQFIAEYLVEKLGTRCVCVGSNFNFGYRGSGSVQTLRDWGHGLEVIEVPPVVVRGDIVSSTRIRELISAGGVSKVGRLLGRWTELEGPIVSGAGRGRSVTVPTLNLQAENELLPAKGVYVTRISLDGGAFLDSITNVGFRPTFGESTISIETFVLNSEVPASVGSARLQLIKRLRDEVKFDSPEALKKQIGLDVARTRHFFHRLDTFRHVE